MMLGYRCFVITSHYDHMAFYFYSAILESIREAIKKMNNSYLISHLDDEEMIAIK